MQVTIKKLRQAGFKVRVIHARRYEPFGTRVLKMSGSTTNSVLSKGGRTTIQITTPDKQVDVEGIADCSVQDSFNRKLGNSIALGRAVAKLSEYPEVKQVLETL
jgi:hypothetical protein